MNIKTVMWLDALEVPEPSPEKSEYRLEGQDNKGGALASVPVYADLSKADPAPFVAVLPAPPKSEALVVKRGEQPIKVLKRSPNPPPALSAVGLRCC